MGVNSATLYPLLKLPPNYISLIVKNNIYILMNRPTYAEDLCERNLS